MIELSSQIVNHGFSFNSLSQIIERNNYTLNFTTLKFNSIFLSIDDLEIKVGNELYRVEGGNIVFLGPQKKFELVNTDAKNLYIIAFSSTFYESPTKNILLNSEIFSNNTCHIFADPYFCNDKHNKVFVIERLLKFSLKDKLLFKSVVHNTIESLLLNAYFHKNYLKKIMPLTQ
ncbi:hypothetical protein [Clostridium sp.]|jgi:hypothetical protein|uniref:hypothetical protein n=1 Tax=Clostridium sp. TaxID=1506 RepID=UPI0025869639|nr:hypothetical protein [Clostridium sp.]MDF2506089.1 helix-turn-helix protein [Clostridium sp.]